MPRYVFPTDTVHRYRFPTHTNDLIMDRGDASASEAFFVIVEPGEMVPRHIHVDVEQVFFVLEGAGILSIGPDGAETYPMGVGDFVRTPPGTAHSVSCAGSGRLVYLSIDCFTAGPPADEPTWDAHVRVMCQVNGWDYDSVRRGPVDSPLRPRE